jgi:hypothetical protein
MRRRHFLKALAAVSATVSLAPKLVIAATIEEATRPYVVWPPTAPQVLAQLAEYGQYVKVSDLLVLPVSVSSADPLTQYGVQGWKVAYVSKIIEPQYRAAVLANLARGGR